MTLPFLAEGTIYEEGTPEEIFKSPKKDRTRRFINHLQVFEMEGRKAEFSGDRLFAGIEQFASRRMITRRITNRMLMIAEELFVQTILPKLRPEDEYHLVYEVSEDNGTGVEMTLTYRGADEDPLAGADELSAAMIRHSCRELTHTCEQGLCIVRAKL